MTGWVDEGRAVDVVCFDLSQAFDTVSHNVLIGKLRKRGLDEQTGRRIENRLNGRAQRAVISGAVSAWRPAASVCPRGSSSAAWMKGQSAPSARLLVIRNWDQWLTHQQAAVPFSETWTGWRAGQRGTQ